MYICQIKCFVNPSVLIHLPQRRQVALLACGHPPGTAEETTILPVPSESVFEASLYKTLSKSLGFAFCCKRVFIKILFAGACHLNKIWI